MPTPNTEYGVQNDGSFRRKSVTEIRSELKRDIRQALGDDVDLSAGSPHGQMLDLATLELSRAWEAMEGLYDASTLRGAYGVQLDRLLALVGVGRLERRPATGEVEFTLGTARSEDINIPQGTRVATPEDADQPAIPFRTTQQVTIPAGSTTVSQVPIRGYRDFEDEDLAIETQLGAATNVAAGTITSVEDAVQGAPDVNNPLPTGETGTRTDGTEYDFQRGRDRETDSAFKRRYRNSLALSGAATKNALLAAARNADETVRGVGVEENNTMEDNTASGGLPRKSIRVTVVGGARDNIGQAIAETRAFGIQPYGTETVTATHDDGTTTTEAFEYGTELDSYVEADLTVDDTWQTADRDRTINAIVGYIGGTDTNGERRGGTGLGEDVIHDQVWKAAMHVDAVQRATVRIGTDPLALDQTDIVVAAGETAATNPDLITLTVTYA